MIKYIQ